MHEIFTLSHSISPSKVNLVEAFKFKTNYFLIMELMEGGSIDTLIEEGSCSEQFSKYTIHKVAQALKVLHDAKTIHRDLNLQNIHCRENGDIKIADLGFAAILTAEHQRRTSSVGNDLYKAPEVIQELDYDSKVDIWSLGILAYRLATSQYPFLESEVRSGNHKATLAKTDIKNSGS